MTICKFPDCKKYASFGFPDGKIERCKTHSVKSFLNVQFLLINHP